MIGRRITLLLAVALAGGGLSGCISLLPQTAPAQLYRFGVGEGTAAQVAPGPLRVVVLGPVVLPRAAAGDGILTSEGAETAYIAGARWIEPANTLFREAIDRTFDRAAPSIRILARGEAGRADAVLSLEVTRFEARYDAPKAPPTVAVTIRARLSAIDGTTIASRVFDVPRPAATDRAGAIVLAFDAATTEALGGVAVWVSQALPAAPR